MEKNKKIIIAIGVAGLVYLLYKKGLFTKKTITEVAQDVKKEVVDVVLPKDVVTPPPSDNDKKLSVEPPMKDCVQVGYDCTKNTYNTIQIPIYGDCNEYQPAMPSCAPPMGGGNDFVVELFRPTAQF